MKQVDIEGLKGRKVAVEVAGELHTLRVKIMLWKMADIVYSELNCNEGLHTIYGTIQNMYHVHCAGAKNSS